MYPVSYVIVGAGGRGRGYAKFAADNPRWAKVVGVAEPLEANRREVAQAHAVPEENVFADWKDLARRRKLADAAIICTQDAMHADPAVRLARKGYHILLEKPMAPNARDCRRIVAAVEKAGVIFAVCHVMRYTSYTTKLKSLIDSGLIGEVVSVQHLEPVGYWHMAHAFVRGHWRNEAESSPMLLSKSCHDLDWLRYIVGRPCVSVSSFGTLKHFRREAMPPGAAERCVSCPAAVEAQCPYSAKKIYGGRLERKQNSWPLNVVIREFTPEALDKALREGPYGRCVYQCDNDVVDTQVVNIQFEGGATAVFTMTAFCAAGGRKTHVFGTRGHIYGDSEKITHFDFLTDKTTEHDTRDDSSGKGHGGGDWGIMKSFTDAVAAGDATKVLSGPRETLESHEMVFAAEKARKEGRVVRMVQRRD
ncbi:MAG: Gfo/Idh/MocA family protein [Phycisphaerae bacterium]